MITIKETTAGGLSFQAPRRGQIYSPHPWFRSAASGKCFGFNIAYLLYLYTGIVVQPRWSQNQLVWPQEETHPCYSTNHHKFNETKSICPLCCFVHGEDNHGVQVCGSTSIKNMRLLLGVQQKSQSKNNGAKDTQDTSIYGQQRKRQVQKAWPVIKKTAIFILKIPMRAALTNCAAKVKWGV